LLWLWLWLLTLHWRLLRRWLHGARKVTQRAHISRTHTLSDFGNFVHEIFVHIHLGWLLTPT
jgi:hypothetical protein